MPVAVTLVSSCYGSVIGYVKRSQSEDLITMRMPNCGDQDILTVKMQTMHRIVKIK